jgi:hypothetical protein
MFEGIEFLDNPLNTPELNPAYYAAERTSFVGVINLELLNCKFHSFIPQQIETLKVTNCTFGDIGEPDSGLGIENDKFGGTFVYDQITVDGYFGAGSAVDSIIVKNSHLQGILGTSSRYSLYENNVLDGTTWDRLLFSAPNAPVFKDTFINNTIITDEDTEIFFNPGRIESFSVSQTLPDGSMLTPINPDLSQEAIIIFLTRGVYLWNLAGNTGAVQSVTQYDPSHFLIKHTLKTTPQVGEKYYYARTQELEWEGNVFQGKTVPIANNPIPIQTIDGQNKTLSYDLSALKDSTKLYLLGNLVALDLNVQKPYQGNASMVVHIMDLEEPSKRFAKIDLTTPGIREISSKSNSGPLGSDILYTTNNEFVQTLQLTVVKGPGWTESDQPVLNMTVHYQNPFESAIK